MSKLGLTEEHFPLLLLLLDNFLIKIDKINKLRLLFNKTSFNIGLNLIYMVNKTMDSWKCVNKYI